MAAGQPWEVLTPSLQVGLTLRVGPTVLQQLEVNNLDAGSVFVQLHDINGVPAPGAVPLLNFQLAADGALFFTPPNPFSAGAIIGKRFLHGVFVGASSDPEAWLSTGVAQLQINGWGRDTE